MPNELAAATSPYLLQHAENPVAWMEWGEPAFAKARAEQKPIFLSIGYSTCHWCHVMARESFADPAIAALLNAEFVSIKVDREERPDVDKVYMTYVQAMAGHGGWPLSAWLTPELKPFFGGTYFPPADRGGRKGLTTVLKAIAHGWAEDREKLVAESERAIGALTDYYAPPAAGTTDEADVVDDASGAFEKCYQHLYESFDARHGGFGGAPKFPRPSNLSFLFRCAAIQGVDSETGREAVEMATLTLQRMVGGGIHDHVGGGFHRYGVDEAWFVPHFEKMLYDQAQIAVCLVEAQRVSGQAGFAWAARGVVDYVLRDLTDPAGGFYAAEDADSAIAHGDAAHAEGAFYVWTAAELARVLGDEADWFARHFGVNAEGNVPAALDPQREFAGRNVLRQRQSIVTTAQEQGGTPEAVADRLAAALDRLRAVRETRPRPHRDDKVVTAWNGLMISALARAAASPAEPLAARAAEYRAAAERAADFVRRELYDEERGVLFRSWRGGRRAATEGFAEDYAFLIAGLLDLYELTFDITRLQWADRLQRTMDARFEDPVGGGYFSAVADDASIVLRLKEDHDGAEPSPNSVAVANLRRLAAMLADDARAAKAGRTAEALRNQWTRHPQALPEMLASLEWVLSTPAQLVIAGDPGAVDFRALWAVAHERPGGRRVILAADGGAGQAWLAERVPALAAMRPREGRATAYWCENYTCRAPVSEPAELRALW